MSFEVSTTSANQAGELQFAFMNIQYEDSRSTKVLPQETRLADLARTLHDSIPSNAIVGICEVDGKDNGYELARLSGFAQSEWVEHDRPNEYIGFMGKELPMVDFIPLDNESTACLTVYEGVAFVAAHFTYGLLPHRQFQRTRQSITLLDIASDFPEVIMGIDTNTLWWQKPRDQILAAGFQAVLGRPGPRVPTVPIPEQRPYLSRQDRFGQVLGGAAVDAIYIKGLRPRSATTFKGMSDHPGLRIGADRIR